MSTKGENSHKEKMLKCQMNFRLIAKSNQKKQLFDYILRRWLQSVKLSVKESTYARYFQLVDSHLIPLLGKYPIDKVSTQLIEQTVQHWLVSGRLDGQGGLSAKTVSDLLTILKATMKYAACNGYSVKCNLQMITVKKQRKEMRVLSVSEQKELVHFLMKDITLQKLGIFFALFTGIRVGELCALQWKDLDLENGILRISKTMQRIQDVTAREPSKTKIVISTPKSEHSFREIPLTDFVIELLRKYQSFPNAFLLTGVSNRFIEPRTMQNCFQKYIKQCGIESASFHTLRHTFATRCMETGFDVKSLSEILGHANVNITLNRYVHASLDFKRANMDKLAQVANF